MELKTEVQVLKSILAVNLDINIWSAKTKLNPEDFAHSELPPEKLVSLGSKDLRSGRNKDIRYAQSQGCESAR